MHKACDEHLQENHDSLVQMSLFILKKKKKKKKKSNSKTFRHQLQNLYISWSYMGVSRGRISNVFILTYLIHFATL